MKQSNATVAYDFIRKRILSGEYPPDKPLITEQLSSDIGISRTPIKEALLQLETDGLVVNRARLGASVKRLDFREFRELSFVRLALESQAAGLAAIYRTEDDLLEMQYTYESMQRLTEKILVREDESVVTGLINDDVRFHIAVMTAAKNDLLKKEILRLHLINRVAYYGKVLLDPGWEAAGKSERDTDRRTVLRFHEEIYLAIVQKDSKTAKSKMEDHIQHMIDVGLRAVSSLKSGVTLRQLTPEELAYTP